MEAHQRNVIFVIGAPGAGKGTLCKRLAQASGFKHLSVGDLLRQVTSSPTPGMSDMNKEMNEYVRRQELVPSDFLFAVLEPELSGDPESSKGSLRSQTVLLDGFPREFQQCQQYEEVFGRPTLVLLFDCPRALAEQRVVSRNAGRAGDNFETFQKRYHEFAKLNPPILEYYRSQGSLITVDTSGEACQSWEKLLRQLQNSPSWKALTTCT